MPTAAATDFETAVAAVGGFAEGPAAFSRLSDAELRASVSTISAYRRHGDMMAAWAAAEVARRSSRELGYSGLAQRSGFLSPEAFIQSATGTTRADAAKLVSVGTMMAEAEAAEEEAERDPGSPFAVVPWLAGVARAVRMSTLSVDAADAIRRGLGDPDPAVAAEKLAAAADGLLAESIDVNVDQLYRLARRLRDGLDADGIAKRAKTQHDGRFLKIWQQTDGMVRMNAAFAPEDGQFALSVYDGATSPRRGGPRFVDPEAKARAEALVEDERSTEQIAADAFIALLRIGSAADPGRIVVGHRRPAVRILVTQGTIAARAGHGELEGHPDPVPFETVERHLCESGFVPIRFDDDGQCVNLGREQRLFTERQRIALAARDGGCRWPGCDRPPSWTEAHHIDQWKRDEGRTDLADGILLCRAHHMGLHNNHWDILREGADYRLRPPVNVDPTQALIPMPSKSPLMLELFARKHVS